MNPGKKKILIVTGEVSGDLHGSRLAAGILRLDPEVEIIGVGGEHLREAGARVILDSAQLAVVGITEVLGHFRALLKAYIDLKSFIRKSRITLLILIDFPDFNLALARIAKEAGIPVLYYISPQVWAWRSGRIRKIAARVDRMAVIFPFEVPLYQNAGLPVEFVGHPLLDVGELTQTENSPSPEQWAGEPLVALLPGSRGREVKSLLPEMIRAARILEMKKPGIRFILPVAPGFKTQELRQIVQNSTLSIIIVEGRTYEAIRAAELAIVASGTATLETAILGKPMVIVYRVSPLSYGVGKMLIRVKQVGLVNIVAGKKVVPELLQGEATGERMAAEALKILEDEPYRREMLRSLAEVRTQLGAPGAANRVARIALEMIQK